MTERYSKNLEGKKLRTPSDAANYWGSIGVAQINIGFRQPVSYLIAADKETDGLRSILSVSFTGDRWQSSRDSKISALSWRLDAYVGTNEKLVTAVNSLVRIIGFRPARNTESKDVDKPYRDLLFLSGEVVVSIVNDHSIRANIGKVLGLTILSKDQTYPVWVPD